MSTIAAAQTKADNLRGAFTTSLRIADARGRFKSLLPLVKEPPRE
jgi:hypothetical protein